MLSRKAIALAALLTTVLGGVLLFIWLFRGRLPAHQLEIKSLAVLPLENLSGDPDYFADGMTEALITDLAKIGALRVISRQSVMKYKGTRQSPWDIAQELKVDAVVVGSVLRGDDKVRITAQLIHPATDRHLWSESYERDLREILALQREVTRAIAGEIHVKLTTHEQLRLAKTRPVVNREAYQLYLKGRYSWNRRTRESLKTAVDYFEKAIHEDPAFALAYAGLAECYATIPSYADVPPRESYPKARAAALKSLELDDTLAEAHTALALVKFAYDWDWDGAEREYKRALELNASYPTAWQWYAEFLASHKRFNEALATAKRAQQLDPLSPVIGTVVGNMFYVSRRYDEAIEQYRETLAMDPNFGFTHWCLGNVYTLKAMYLAAIGEFEADGRLRAGTLGSVAHLGYAYAVSGNKSEALKMLAELTVRSERGYVPAVEMIRLCVGLGDKDCAFKWLGRALEDRSETLVVWVAVDPMFDPLRSDPRFSQALRRMKLTP